MSDELKSGENLSKGLRRVARKGMDKALKRLSADVKKEDSEAVHDARKELKFLRSTLRMLKPGTGAHFYRTENRAMQRAGRALAPMRDVDVLVKTLEQLRCCCHGKAALVAFGKLRSELLRRRRRVFRQRRKLIREGREVLAAARKRVKDWPLEKVKWKDINRGIRRTYKQGAEAFRLAEKTPLPANMHEWRKRAKNLWQQIMILKPIQPERLGALETKMKRLGDYLGDAHDMVLLEAAILRTELDKENRNLIEKLIQVRKDKLQRAALQCGEALYRQKPKAFGRQFKRYARAWRS